VKTADILESQAVRWCLRILSIGSAEQGWRLEAPVDS